MFEDLYRFVDKLKFDYEQLENNFNNVSKQNEFLDKELKKYKYFNTKLQHNRHISTKELSLIEEKIEDYLKESKSTLVLYGSRAFNYYLPDFLKLEAKDFDLFLVSDDEMTKGSSFVENFIGYLSSVFSGKHITQRDSLHNAPWTTSILYCGRTIIDVTEKTNLDCSLLEVDQDLNIRYMNLEWLIHNSLEIMAKDSALYRHKKEEHRLQRILQAIRVGFLEDKDDSIKQVLHGKFEWNIGKTDPEHAIILREKNNLENEVENLKKELKKLRNQTKGDLVKFAKLEDELQQERKKVTTVELLMQENNILEKKNEELTRENKILKNLNEDMVQENNSYKKKNQDNENFQNKYNQLLEKYRQLNKQSNKKNRRKNRSNKSEECSLDYKSYFDHAKRAYDVLEKEHKKVKEESNKLISDKDKEILEYISIVDNITNINSELSKSSDKLKKEQENSKCLLRKFAAIHFWNTFSKFIGHITEAEFCDRERTFKRHLTGPHYCPDCEKLKKKDSKYLFFKYNIKVFKKDMMVDMEDFDKGSALTESLKSSNFNEKIEYAVYILPVFEHYDVESSSYIFFGEIDKTNYSICSSCFFMTMSQVIGIVNK